MSMEPVDADAAAAPEPGVGRLRRNTVDRFNDELSVLDRPLESDVEYYDDPPRRPWWRRAGLIVGALALFAGIGGLALARRSSLASGESRPPLVAATSRPAPPRPQMATATAPALPTHPLARGEAKATRQAPQRTKSRHHGRHR